MNKFLLLSASCVALTAMSSAVSAQSIDYTTMEELFGEPVTTSATGKPQRMSEVPVSMEILTQDDIRRSGAVNIPEVLRQVNGVSVVQKTAENYDVAIRGYNQHASQRLLVLVNGRQVYLDHYGYTDWASIPVQLEEIRQIEVVKGPNTALFGFNAVNGVVNIVTFNPLYDDVASAGVTVGTSSYGKAHYVQTLSLGDSAATRISGSLMKADSFDNARNSAATFSEGFHDPNSASVNVDTMFQLDDSSQLRVELSSNTNKAGGMSSAGEAVNNDFETQAAKISYEVDSDYGLIKANVYKNFLDWNFDFQSTSSTTEASNEVFVAQLENVIQLNPQHTVRVQGEYRENELEGSLMPDGAKIGYEVYALGGMWNWNIDDRWSWNNALRADHLRLDHSGPFTSGSPYSDSDYDQSFTEFSYNSGVVFKPSQKDTLRLSTARGLEVPSLLEFGVDADAAGGAVLIGGQPRLDTAVVTNYELAWDRKLDAIENGLLRSAVFLNKTKDVKTIQGNISGANYMSDNVGDSSSYGVELALEGTYKQNFNWGVGYIFQEIDDDFNNGHVGNSLTIAKEYDESNPSHQINLNLGYQKDSWEADALFYYVSETQPYSGSIFTSFTQEDVDDYVGANARIAYTFDKHDVTVALHGQQLLSANTQTSVSPDVDRRVFVSLTKKF